MSTATVNQAAIRERTEELTAMSDGELQAFAVGAIESIEDSLVDYCIAVVEMERRQLDVSDFVKYIPKYYARIASGQVSAKAWLRFGEYPLLMDRVSTLPIAKQEALGNGERISVVQTRNDGYDPRNNKMMDPLELTPDQIRRVFTEGKVRDLNSQAAWIETESSREPRESKMRLIVELDEELDEKLSQLAALVGVTKKEYVRRLIKKAK
jgi:hypothetical protein